MIDGASQPEDQIRASPALRRNISTSDLSMIQLASNVLTSVGGKENPC
jgi:hypothetical protein